MDDGSSAKITALLQAAHGDRRVQEELFRLVQTEFRQIAQRFVGREPADLSLQVTMLVTDAFRKLVRRRPAVWKNRRHFVGTAAKVMRRQLIDHARRKATAKRGGGRLVGGLDTAIEKGDSGDPQTVVDLQDVFEKLESDQPDAFVVFDLHYVMEWSLHEIAAQLELSYSTVRRRWKLACALLSRELRID